MKPAEVLEEALALQKSKGEDYQHSVSSVRQADYYPRGIETIYEVMNMKMLRLRSLIDWLKANPNADVNHESMKDSCVDLINYASFLASYLDKGIDGQRPNTDAFNVEYEATPTGTLTWTSPPEKAYESAIEQNISMFSKFPGSLVEQAQAILDEADANSR